MIPMSTALFDQVLSNTSYGSSVLSENHDTGSIAVDESSLDGSVMSAAGVWLRGGRWDSCEMGLTQAEAQARYDAANTPEKRAVFLADLRVRALRRASLSVANGRVEFAAAF